MGAGRLGAYSAMAGVTAVVAAYALMPGGWVPPPLRAFIAAPAASHGAAAVPAPRPALPAPAPAPVPPQPLSAAADPAFDALRARMHWVRTRVGTQSRLTLDRRSRLLLAKAAAERAHLDQVGLTFADVYGIITAETSWMPRPGTGKDGAPSLGIAQFEPGTAQLVGLRDPQDAVEAVFAAARQMHEAAIWSASRLRGLKLDAAQRADKLREGVSVYYNLSSRGRAAWNGLNTETLPRETQLHIFNARAGAQEAALFEAQLRAQRFRLGHPQAVVTAGDPAGGG